MTSEAYYGNIRHDHKTRWGLWKPNCKSRNGNSLMGKEMALHTAKGKTFVPCCTSESIPAVIPPSLYFSLASEETIKEEKSRKTFQMSLGEDEFRDNTTPEKTKPAKISSSILQ
ncbi:hypothetical protein CDAR_457831 [Caerostris darwini]|uniref:Uncharacterized protein n=1 Tax=Caerostris darwini TaxID=1538125 RepID=A0AAV4V8L8_9ARAC|nr:hypothetical protein CDAR_457831 [Caerostris darwini]